LFLLCKGENRKKIAKYVFANHCGRGITQKKEMQAKNQPMKRRCKQVAEQELNERKHSRRRVISKFFCDEIRSLQRRT
jgi:hypothetical protein